MITKDIGTYLEKRFATQLSSISELSKSDKGKALVEDERTLYDFDKITKELYKSNIPESADAIYATDKVVFFVEYKSGFKKKINKYNFDKSKMSCYEDESKYCEAYAKLFFKNQRNEDEVLKQSIRFKAVESYITFMDKILPMSVESSPKKNKSLVYCVVVDDYVENMEDILTGLAKKPSDDNTITRIRDSLSRFCITDDKKYYYDSIQVFSPHEFKRYLTELAI